MGKMGEVLCVSCGFIADFNGFIADLIPVLYLCIIYDDRLLYIYNIISCIYIIYMQMIYDRY